MCWRDQLKPRLHYFWTSYGLLMIVWLLLVHLPFSMAHDGKGIERILTESDTFFWGLGFGILYAFYSLRSAKPLWYLMFPMAIIGIIGTTASFFEIFQGTHETFKIWGLIEVPSYVWNISDLMVVGSMTLVTLYFVLPSISRYLQRHIRFLRRRRNWVIVIIAIIITFIIIHILTHRA